MDEMQLPEYACQKHVWALKIAAIEFHLDGSAEIAPEDRRYAVLDTGPEYRKRFNGDEADLGYYVRYKDGYESWSPTKAFEDGYSLTR